MHYTINEQRQNQQVRLKPDQPQVQYVVGHSLGAGWVRHIVELKRGDTADNPASSKGPIYGPCVVVYDVARSGIRASVYEDAGGFYDALARTRDEFGAEQ